MRKEDSLNVLEALLEGIPKEKLEEYGIKRIIQEFAKEVLENSRDY